jgi:cold shock CspA family protein
MKGIIKWFSSDKGYGFVTSENNKDHYFNIQSINGAVLPSNGDAVSFESKPGNKGLRAFDIKITSKNRTQKNIKSDDRIDCPDCGKKIVPRMITYHGKPEKSVCPYCAATVKTFGSNDLSGLIFVVVCFIAILFF